MRLWKTLAVVILCLAAAAAAFSAGYATHMVLSDVAAPTPYIQLVGGPASPELNQEADFSLFWEAWGLLEDHFLGQLPTSQRASYGAIRGVLTEVNDPHTLFMEPARRQIERDEHRGAFGGIGVWVYQREDDRQYVLTPQEEGPAAQAGIQDGDVVVQVDETLIDPETTHYDDIVAMIRGPVGTFVHLRVRRLGVPSDLAFDVVRKEFQTPSVEWRMLDDRAPHVGYMRISMFTERTLKEVEGALEHLNERGARRLVLDLRDNPGGLLDSAVEVASQFLDGGAVMFERKRDGTEKVYAVRSGGKAQAIPLVILTNGGTASASEILAGALQDRGRATIVGEPTYGKGSVQLVFDLRDGSSIHITVARWLTPRHHEIDGKGIHPDQLVGLSYEDREAGRDPQLAAAVAQLAMLER